MDPTKRTAGNEYIEITGAAEHNLKNIDLSIPKRHFVVFSGVSGSGKSSLAFDTIYAEGRRRYVESLSSYARQFLGQMDKPRYDAIRGLAPTIAIEQKKATSNPRSTVGTITEIADYLRVLFARCGEQHCHKCGRRAGRSSPQELVDTIRAKFANERITFTAPLFQDRKGEFRETLQALQAQGFLRVRLNGEIARIDGLKIPPRSKNSLEAVVDRMKVDEENSIRLTEAVEAALRLGDDWLKVLHGNEEHVYSTEHACTECEIGLPEPAPQLFSFNNPLGMCDTCEGIGKRMEADPKKVVPDESLSINQGAVVPWRKVLDRASMSRSYIEGIAEALGFSLDTPWRELPRDIRKKLLYGTSENVEISVVSGSRRWKSNRPLEGVLNRYARLFRETRSSGTRMFYMQFMSQADCPDCNGTRLREEARAFLTGGKNMAELSAMTVSEAWHFFEHLKLEGNALVVGTELVKELKNRLRFLLDVGLEYLTLDRAGATLSGGESQRIRLASQLGSELSGVTYVLDEPSIGLHSRGQRQVAFHARKAP
ncbi:MAG: hypothetical protein U5N86_01240 [Planctomycetota bacterium]|nr:hypothetical protein [Planctomycetota bacterium]